ncbi:SRPBCC family protein [Halovenus sp. WSH3]|uniref:SRPBCC family protein n=1 Tax=Halovenus carboxidivorans TaxID=2692199 RepID=A0A6B0T9P2_9EURY|nr:SRPBCC family protein [Halovenus carboxidivorans]MXR51961.1 SRPBCC family protein [Halovenus carboxidivorans]
MTAVSESIEIDRPVSEVFAYLDDPHNHATITPGITDIRNVEPLDNGGKRLEHTYEMAGVGIDGELVEQIHEENERMRFEMRGRLTGEIDLRFEDLDGRTRVTYSAEYDIPGRVLSAAAEPVVKRYNRRQLRKTLDNLKRELESED